MLVCQVVIAVLLVNTEPAHSHTLVICRLDVHR